MKDKRNRREKKLQTSGEPLLMMHNTIPTMISEVQVGKE